MKLKKACEIAQGCNLTTVGEAVSNIRYHAVSLLSYDRMQEELAELEREAEPYLANAKVADVLAYLDGDSTPENQAAFEDFLCKKQDGIDNAAHQLLCDMASTALDPDGSALEWNMEYIGDLLDYAESILSKHGIPTCRPFYESDDRRPCYIGGDCKRGDCPMRKGDAEKA